MLLRFFPSSFLQKNDNAAFQNCPVPCTLRLGGQHVHLLPNTKSLEVEMRYRNGKLWVNHLHSKISQDLLWFLINLQYFLCCLKMNFISKPLKSFISDLF